MKRILSVIFAIVMMLSIMPTNVLAAVKLLAPTETLTNVASSGKIKVSWTKVAKASKYQVYRATSKSGTYSLMVTKTATSYTNTSAIAGKTYYYKVRAVDANGNKGSYSAVKHRTCDLARPEVKATTSSKGYPKLTWDKISGAESYKVYRATSKSGTYKLMKTTTSTSYTNTSAESGKTYYYKVKAVCSKSAADSAYSSVVSTKRNSVNKKIVAGFIYLHDSNSYYDYSFMKAAEETCAKMGIDCYQLNNVSESNECFDAIMELIDWGCNFIFADSFGHEDFMIQAAKDYPDVQFVHATGTKAHTVNLSNYHNAFASIYEGRYLTGVAAGMKMNEMIEAGRFTPKEAKLGFVGAFTYAEVISSYTAYYLGAKSVCPSVTMDVQFTGSWYDETAEKEAANKLINNGCKIISQYSDSLGAPMACEYAGLPNVSYNFSPKDYCPNTNLITTRIDWSPFFTYAFNCMKNGKSIDTDWTGTLADGSIIVDGLNTRVAAKGTQKKIDEIKNKLINGTMHVFDTSSFTVNGKRVKSYMADVDTDISFTPDTQTISGGYFHESEYRSAPYFDVRIDGIRLYNEKF